MTTMAVPHRPLRRPLPGGARAGIALAILLAVLAAALLVKSHVEADEQTAVAAFLTTAAPVEQAITFAEFDAVETGMRYQEVVHVLGVSGTEVSRVDIPGAETVMYSWQNPDGSNMIVTFQNDHVVSKAQAGL